MATAGKTTGKLSALRVNSASKPGMINDGNGLYLKIDEGGSKSWILRYKVRGRSRKFGLGPTHTIPLALAREKAANARRLLLDGVDPIEEKRKAKAALMLEAAKTITFDQCAKNYIEENKAAWKNAKHVSEWGTTLKRYASPVFGHLAVADVDVGLIVRALKPIWTEIPETASRVRQRIERVLDYAKANSFRDGENPASLKGNLAHILPKQTKQIKAVKNHPAMPHAEVGTLMVELREVDEIAAHALQFTILTAARTGEVVGAKWEEIDLDKKLWNVPGVRMKSGVDHVVPLSPSALAVLKKMQAIRDQRDACEFVFPSETENNKPMREHGMRAVLNYRIKRRDVAVHGMRSSFRDWAAERNYPDAHAEAALAHAIPDKVKAAYLRTKFIPERRKMMDAWAAYTSSPTADAKIIPMRRGRK
jgi:integrase